MDLLELEKRDISKKFRHPWEQARLEIVKKKIFEIKKNNNFKKINIIDIGCGDLYVLENLVDCFSFESCFGIDISFNEDQLLKFNSKLNSKNIKVCKGLEEVKVDNDTVSIILLLDVVEHIEDDKSFMKSLHNYSFLNNDTRIIITVPSYDFLFSRHDDLLLHFRRYSSKGIMGLVKNSSFEMVSRGYFFSLLILPRFLVILKEKFTKNIENKESGLSSWDKGFFLTNLITTFLLIDYKISEFFKRIGIKIPGLSNYIICKKHV